MILKEDQAIEYLESIRETIHGEDSLWNLPLLNKMLELEVLFLNRLTQNGHPELAIITVDATGLPQLESWRVDLSNILKDFDRLKTKNSLEIMPFKNQLINALPNGILEEGQKLAVKLIEDLPLIRAFSGTDSSFKHALSANGDFPFFKKTNFPGLLFIGVDTIQDWFKFSNSHEFALKFFPCLEDSPALLCVGFKQNLSFVNITDKNQGLAARLAQTRSAKIREALHFTNPIQQALFDFDPTGFTASQTRQYLNALSELNELAAGSKKFIDAAINCQYQSGEEITSQVTNLASQTNRIFESLDDDQLRQNLQLALAKSIESFYGQEKPKPLPKDTESIKISDVPDRKKTLKSAAKQRIQEILEQQVKEEPVTTPYSIMEAALENYQFIERLVNDKPIQEYLVFRQNFRIALAGGGINTWRLDFGSSSPILIPTFRLVADEKIHSFLTLAQHSMNPCSIDQETLYTWCNNNFYYKFVVVLSNLNRKKILKTIAKNL